MEASSGRVDAGRVISEAFQTYREHAGPLLGGAILVIGVAAVITALFSASGSLLLVLVGTIISLVAQFLYTGYVVKLVQDARDGRLDQSVGELLSAAAPFIPTLALNGILAGIAILIGFVLLIVPGLILLTIWAVISPAIVVENKGVMEAFGRSRELVKGDGWAVFGAILIAFVLIAVFSLIAGAIGASIGDDVGSAVATTITQILVVPIAGLVSSILFFDLGGGGEEPEVAAV